FWFPVLVAAALSAFTSPDRSPYFAVRVV
ncbi:MAG: hypothetical protein QOI66_3166, partial [Myxococcales bacterium]|nr:hypothetical protein [Myxococcales bacterium]